MMKRTLFLFPISRRKIGLKKMLFKRKIAAFIDYFILGAVLPFADSRICRNGFGGSSSV